MPPLPSWRSSSTPGDARKRSELAGSTASLSVSLQRRNTGKMIENVREAEVVNILHTKMMPIMSNERHIVLIIVLSMAARLRRLRVRRLLLLARTGTCLPVGAATKPAGAIALETIPHAGVFIWMGVGLSRGRNDWNDARIFGFFSAGWHPRQLWGVLIFKMRRMKRPDVSV